MRYIKDQRHLRGDKESKERSKLSPREANVASKRAKPKSRAQHRKAEIPNVIAPGNFNHVEKLLVDNSMKYSFW